MKLKYNERNNLFILLLVPVLIFLKFNELQRHHSDSSYNRMVIVIFICVFALVFVSLFIYKMVVVNRYKKHGTKVQGYIVDNEIYRCRKIRNYKLKFWYDNKIYTIDRLCYNAAYRYIAQDLKSIHQTCSDFSQIKKYPIDIYLYDGKYSADVESVKLNENL